jgi:hypothetical protein
LDGDSTTHSAVSFGELLRKRLTSPELSKTIFERGNQFLMADFLKKIGQ